MDLTDQPTGFFSDQTSSDESRDSVKAGFPFLSIDVTQVDLELLGRYFRQAETLRFLPLWQAEEVMAIATPSPYDVGHLRKIRKELPFSFRIVGISSLNYEQVFALAIDLLPAVEKQKKTEVLSIIDRETMTLFEPWETYGQGETQIARSIIRRALIMGASDIHLLPYPDRMEIRYRVNGALERLPPMSVQAGEKATHGIKMLGELRLTDNQSFMRTRITIGFSDLEKKVDLRVEIQPTPHGLSTIMRILDGTFLRGPANLPFEPRDCEIIADCIAKSHGLILITGPTGSGKSTTLYKTLMLVDRVEKMVRTIEDPIEYLVDGIAQTETGGRDEDGRERNFANILRSMMRADPDVIMVGEIRDSETATVAGHAALTGHLLLSTLHTNSAVGSVSRLLGLGMEPDILASTLVMVGAQRLLPRLCESCKRPIKPPLIATDHFAENGMTPPEFLYERGGCSKCKFTGYSGRAMVYELFVPTDEIRDLIASRTGDELIRRKWVESGGRPLELRGLKLVQDGVIEYHEVRALSKARSA